MAGDVKRIVESGVGKMRVAFRSRPEDLVAAIGPGIAACCYAVGEEVRTEFGSQFSYAADLFHEVSDSDPVRQKYPMLFLTARAPGHSNLGPSLHLDLMEANRRQLLDAGLRAESITVVGSAPAARTTGTSRTGPSRGSRGGCCRWWGFGAKGGSTPPGAHEYGSIGPLIRAWRL